MVDVAPSAKFPLAFLKSAFSVKVLVGSFGIVKLMFVSVPLAPLYVLVEDNSVLPSYKYTTLGALLAVVAIPSVSLYSSVLKIALLFFAFRLNTASVTPVVSAVWFTSTARATGLSALAVSSRSAVLGSCTVIVLVDKLAVGPVCVRPAPSVPRTESAIWVKMMSCVVSPTGIPLTAFTVTVIFLVVSFGTSMLKSPTRT